MVPKHVSIEFRITFTQNFVIIWTVNMKDAKKVLNVLIVKRINMKRNMYMMTFTHGQKNVYSLIYDLEYYILLDRKRP